MKTCIKALLSYALATVSDSAWSAASPFCPGGKRYGRDLQIWCPAGLRGQHQKKTPHHRGLLISAALLFGGLAITVRALKTKRRTTMSKLGTALAFLAGAALGGVSAWYVAKTRYDELSEQEIDSAKQAFYAREQQLKEEIACSEGAVGQRGRAGGGAQNRFGGNKNQEKGDINDYAKMVSGLDIPAPRCPRSRSMRWRPLCHLPGGIWGDGRLRPDQPDLF